ncbi:MAG: DUF2157 domain-containing protein, partial [Terriglobales bacterium]
MSEQESYRFRVALQEEIGKWQTEGVVSDGLANVLKTRYPLPNQISRVTSILLVVGAVLTGLGGVLFVAANWEHMARLLKVVVIAAAILASYVGAWHCKYSPGNHPRFGSALLLVGTLFYGAGIWLISQIFNCETSLSHGLFLWILGSAALAFVTRSRMIAFLLAILIPFWNFTEVDLRLFSSDIPALSLLSFTPSMLVGAYLCARSESKGALYVLLAGGMLWMTSLSGLWWAATVLYGAFLFLMFLWLRFDRPMVANPCLYMGVTSVLLGYFIGTFDKSAHTAQMQATINMALMLAAIIGGAALVAMKKNQEELEIVGALCGSIAAVILCGSLDGTLRTMLANTFLVLLIAGLIMLGLKFRKGALINLSIGFIVVDIWARYFDLFYSTLDRS